MVKSLDLAMLEALFKSDKAEDREEAQRQFPKMEADYGSDPRLQRLALELAEWYRSQNKFADAARQYAGVADRGRDLNEDDTMKLYSTAGRLYSQAGYEAQKQRNNMGFCFYLAPAPEGVVKEDPPLIKTYAPLLREVTVTWPKGPAVTPGDNLVALSKACGVPFVWDPDKEPRQSVARFLSERRGKQQPLVDGKYGVAQALGLILDLNVHRLTFDIGLTGGTPTLARSAADDEPGVERPRTIEIYHQELADVRYKPLGRVHGPWHQVYANKTVMFFNIVQRIEEVTGTRFIWAEGLDQQPKLAVEYRDVPRGMNDQNVTCAAVLRATLGRTGLKYSVQPRQIAADYYEAAKDCFSKVRKINPSSKWGEEALYIVATNLYNLQEYSKMKLVLTEYLKQFDDRSNRFYHQANFWVGWCSEEDHKNREASNYYARAAEERMILFKLPEGKAPPARPELKALLSYDTQFAITEPVTGEFKKVGLEEVCRFFRIHTHVDIQVDRSVGTLPPVERPAFRGTPALDILYGVLQEFGLSARVENVNAEAAEMAYFRMAVVYRKENMMQQALENCNTLLTRYSKTKRRRDVQRMMIDIYKGLRDYAKVMEVLDELIKTSEDDAERQKLRSEMSWIYFDMADYDRAARAFKDAMGAGGGESVPARDGYARCLLRTDKFAEAETQFETLAKSTGGEYRRFLYDLLLFYCRFMQTQGESRKAEEREFPAKAKEILLKFMRSDDGAQQDPAFQAQITWIFYIEGLVALEKGREAEGIEKLNSATNSPDEFVSGDAGLRVGLHYRKQNRLAKAREALEYILVSAKSDSRVRVAFQLAEVCEKLGEPQKAMPYYKQIVQNYPLSPYAERVKKHPPYQDWERAGGGAGKPAPAPAPAPAPK
jgi:tetratricopeptide (TPR) repeat protein